MKITWFILIFVIIAGLSLVFPIDKASAQEIPTNLQDIISPLKNLVDIAEKFSEQLKIKMSESSITKKIISYIPQDQESFLNSLNRLTNLASGVNRWLDTTIGINVNVVLRFAKTLIIGVIKVVTAAVREGMSLF